MSVSVVELFNFNGKSVRAVHFADKEFIVAGDVWRALGYYGNNGKTAIQRQVPKRYKLHFRDLAVNGQFHKDTLLLTEKGLRHFLMTCKRPEVGGFAKKMGVNVESSIYLSKEQDTMSYILEVFRGEDMISEFSIDGYRIDLYFPSHRLAVECDEFDHRDRDIMYEINRQKCIENILGCTFVRFNPDAEDFCIFKVLNEIFLNLRKKFCQP